MSPPESSHFDEQVLSDLSAGLLEPAQDSLVRSHLQDCAQCTELRDEVDAVPQLLASLSGPGPIPADVAASLDAALAAAMREIDMESTATAEAPRHTAASERVASGATVTPLRPRRARRAGWSTRWLQVAAAAVVAVALGGILVPAVTNRDQSAQDETSSASGGRDAAQDTGGTDGAAGATELSAFPTVLATGNDYTPETVGDAARSLVQRRAGADADAPDPPVADENPGTPEAAPGASGGQGDAAVMLAVPPFAGLGDPAALTACATTLAGGIPTAPLAVDLASYAGEPAAIFVLATPDDSASLDVFVVAPECSGADLRYFVRVPR